MYCIDIMLYVYTIICRKIILIYPCVCVYLQLSIPIDEFERKKVFKCTFVNSRVKEDVSQSTAFSQAHIT